jgi:hypothetical protein
VKVNIPHRVDQVYGRKLSVNGADGSRAIAEYVGDLSPAQMLAAMRYLEPSEDIRS